MPRALLKIDRFEGGLNDDANPRDIADNECQQADDVCFDTIGKIRLIGSSVNNTDENWTNGFSDIKTMTQGYGLYIFGAGPDEIMYLAGAGYNADSDSILVVVSWGGTQQGSVQELEVTSTNFRPVFYYIESLRVCDSNFDNTDSIVKWWGYIKRTHFGNTPDSFPQTNYAAFYFKTNLLAAPTMGLIGVLEGVATGGDIDTLTDTGFFTNWTATQIDGNGYIAANTTENTGVAINTRTSANEVETDALDGGDVWNGDTYFIHPAAGTGFNLNIVPTAGDDTWDDEDYEFMSTFIYDDIQESLPFSYDETITLAAGEYFVLGVYCTAPFDPRISGGRIYTRVVDSNDAWILLIDIDLTSGIRSSLENEYIRWDNLDSGWLSNYVMSEVNSHDPNIDTYESLNGYKSNVPVFTIKWKTAVVSNRVTYAGNVYYDGVHYPDSIFKSYVNRFDTFTKKRRLDVKLSDGEKIVKLEEFADRILEYKTDTLYIINVSQEVEFLESTHPFMGVDYPYWTIKTEYGVAWFNDRGCYLYDGKQIIDLFLRDGKRRISLINWRAFLGDNPAIDYHAKDKKLLILADTNGANIDVMLFDFVTGSWSKAQNKYGGSGEVLSNLVTDWNGNATNLMCVTNTMALQKWVDTAVDSTTLNYITKEYDFVVPGIKKNLYAIKITYYLSGSNTPLIRYSTNGSTTFGYEFDTLLSNTNGIWITKTLKPDTPAEAQNIYSITLKIYASGTVDSNFEIDDITPIYRAKGMR